MRQINKRRLLEYLIYWEIKEILYQFSFDFKGNWLDFEFKSDLLDDLNEISEILKSLSYARYVEALRIRFKNWYRSTYWKNLAVEDVIPAEDLSLINSKW
jgi:hypothetical protein